MAFKGITFAGQNVTPKNDGGLYQAHYGDGILWGCSMAVSGDDLVIQSGEFIAGGRVCFVDGATNVDLSGRVNNTGYIQVIMNYDLSQGEGSQWYTSFVESATTTFPALTQDDINDNDTLYQIELAVVQVSGGNLTSVYSSIRPSIVTSQSFLAKGTTDLNPHLDFYDKDGNPVGTLWEQQSSGDFRLYGFKTDGSTASAGAYMEQGGKLTLFGNGDNIVLRPNGAASTTGQVTLDTTGQMRGGHAWVSTSGSTATTVATTGTTLGTLTSCSGLHICQWSIRFSSIPSAQQIRITVNGSSEDHYMLSASSSRYLKGMCLGNGSPSLEVMPLAANCTVGSWSLYAMMF